MLALIAGQGHLPMVLIKALRLQGTDFQLCQMADFPANVFIDQDVLEFRIEHLGSFLQQLKDRGVTQVVFAGAVHRPKIDPTAIDAATMPLVPRMMQALQQGDDAALRTVIEIFEEAGLTICAAHQIMPDLMLPEGVLTAVKPGDQHLRDADRGEQVIGALSAADIGQACVVARGQVIAVETLPGTDWMLSSLDPARLPQSDARPTGGLMYKAPKTGQDRRIDMPTIGPDTIHGIAAAGLDGLVIEAGGVQVLDRAKVILLADEKGLFLWARKRSS
ncbi:LpxI family protein [Pseudaestuariivita rosea]|uniref:LpxI family protein n=1 Tax=Pseudaestuariivita rosea TaxID=2763263 RepID=UPI001ABAB8CE|nr:UDP-2,3-diacylglucosamine diphosphatase LpxI [Pseudaestuariivita rosea]